MKSLQPQNAHAKGAPTVNLTNLDDAFVRISFKDSINAQMDREESKMYRDWINNGMA